MATTAMPIDQTTSPHARPRITQTAAETRKEIQQGLYNCLLGREEKSDFADFVQALAHDGPTWVPSKSALLATLRQMERASVTPEGWAMFYASGWKDEWSLE